MVILQKILASAQKSYGGAGHNKTIVEHIRFIAAQRARGYETPYGWTHAPFDDQLLYDVSERAAAVRARQPKAIVLIGIGGSSLGAQAVWDALATPFHSSLEFFCLDSPDAHYVDAVYAHIENILHHNGCVALIIVSKSGTTTETVALGSIFINLLRTYNTLYNELITIITDENSVLHQWAIEHNMYVMFIPKHIGGRYSVMTAAGLLPLACLGVDCYALFNGARTMTSACTSEIIDDNPAMQTALFIYEQYQKSVPIIDLFFFSKQFLSFGGWWRQLFAESLGKSVSLDKNARIHAMTPTISLGTNDLHSVAQLYFAHPESRCTIFIIAGQQSAYAVPQDMKVNTLVPHLEDLSVSSVMCAIRDAVLQAYEHDAMPFISLKINTIDAATMGELMQWAFYTVVYCAQLMQVNPFDQPNVERYKKIVRDILANH